MRVERVYDWQRGTGFVERDPRNLDPKYCERQTTRLGHLSDTHLGKGEPGVRAGQMRRWLETFDGLKVEAVVHSGDLVESPDDEELVRRAFSMIDELSVPVLGVPGNHDIQSPGEHNEITQRWGPYPRVEMVGQVEISLLNSMAWPAAEERREKERKLADESGFYVSGGIGSEQRDAWEKELDPAFEGARILVVHHHLRQPVPAKPWYEENADLMGPLADVEPVLKVARQAGVIAVLHGHRHQYIEPFSPFADLAMINGASSTRRQWPKRARLIDIADDAEAMRVWELARFK